MELRVCDIRLERTYWSIFLKNETYYHLRKNLVFMKFFFSYGIRSTKLYNLIYNIDNNYTV